MHAKIVKMLELQDAMNTKVNPNWITAGNAWGRAIWTEGAELLGHAPWKWWKKGAVINLPQVKIEIVDIWHFGMSLVIEIDRQRNPDHSLSALAEQFVPAFEFVPEKEDDLISATEVLVALAADPHTKGFHLGAFAGMMRAAGMTFDDLYKLYLGKNVLNFFRQDNGYKTGEYITAWDGLEDNDFLNTLMESIDVDSPTVDKDIYAALAAKYELVKLAHTEAAQLNSVA